MGDPLFILVCLLSVAYILYSIYKPAPAPSPERKRPYWKITAQDYEFYATGKPVQYDGRIEFTEESTDDDPPVKVTISGPYVLEEYPDESSPLYSGKIQNGVLIKTI